MKKETATTKSICLYNTPEPLAEEGTWQAFLDEDTTGLVYYFDTATGESLWEPPSSTFPLVRLPRRKQRLADNLRREYRKTRQEMLDGSDGNDANQGLFSPLTAVEEVKEASEEQQQKLDSKTENVEEIGLATLQSFV